MDDSKRLQVIEAHARRFRAAIESCEPKQLPITLRDFPKGSCGDASLLLAEYLKSKGIGPLTYVCGQIVTDHQRGDIQTHAWLEMDDIIIDITPDQFDGVTQQIMVTKDHSWHEQFEITRREGADLNRWIGPAIGPLRRMLGNRDDRARCHCSQTPH